MPKVNRAAADRAAIRSPGLLTAVVCAAIFFDAFDLSITQVALPSIQRSLHLSMAALPWIATTYVVTYGGFLLLGGRAGDLLGARPVFLTGLAVFGLSSAVCGAADNGATLVAARAVQGVGAALTVPTAVAILATAFPDAQARTRAFGVFSAAGASGFTFGLVAGGLITSGLSWRWIFLIKAPAVALALLGALMAVPRMPRVERPAGYDIGGGVTVTLGAVLLTFGITRAGTPNPALHQWAIPVACALLLTAAFVLIEYRSQAPLLPPRLMRQRGLAAATTAALTVLAAPFGVSFLVTLYFQDVLGWSAWQTALPLLPGSVLCVAVSRYVAPALLGRLGLRRVYPGGLLVVAAGDGLLLTIDEARAAWLVTVAALISLGVGMGLAYPAAVVAGVQGVEPGEHGAAAGVTNAALQIGGGIGLAVVAAAVGTGLPTAQTIADVADPLHAVRYGAVAATLLPLAGAAAAGLLPRAGPPAPG